MTLPALGRAMDPALAPFAARLQGKVSVAEFAERVEAARAEFDGLLDTEALALLVLDELGLNEGAFVTLAELAGRTEATVRVVIDRVEAPREFQREGRPPGRVANCAVSDATGEARLTLWDRDAEKAEDGTLVAGARVTLVNARVKESRWGVELHVGPWTVLEVEGALDPAKRKLLMDVQEGADPVGAAMGAQEEVPRKSFQARLVEASVPLRGLLAAVGPTRTYRKRDGGVGFVCDLDVDAADGRVRVVCWDEAVKKARGFEIGAPLSIEGLVAKPKGADVEWHTTEGTRLRAASEGAPE